MKTKKLIAATLSILAAGATVYLMAQGIKARVATGLPIEQINPNGACASF